MARARILEDFDSIELHELDDDELKAFIESARKECTRRYAHAAELYGVPCQEGRRRYQSYKRARRVLERLIDELEIR